jgi:hypothetical protein
MRTEEINAILFDAINPEFIDPYIKGEDIPAVTFVIEAADELYMRFIERTTFYEDFPQFKCIEDVVSNDDVTINIYATINEDKEVFFELSYMDYTGENGNSKQYDVTISSNENRDFYNLIDSKCKKHEGKSVAEVIEDYKKEFDEDDD